MGLRADILDFKCFNELRNGVNFDQNLADFTPNLVGNVGERLKVTYRVQIEPTASTGPSEKWLMNNGRVQRASGSFIEDGIIVGNVVNFLSNWSDRSDTRTQEFIATVDFISDDGTVMEFSVISGAQSSIGEVEDVGFDMDFALTANKNTAALIKFGLLNNDENFNVLSKVSGNEQIYYVAEITGVDVMIPLGKFRDWVTGDMTIEDTTNEDYVQEFTIEHIFINNPFYIINYRENLVNNTTPELYEGQNSLKYAIETDVRKTLTDISSKKVDVLENLEGVTGWFGENFNGFNANYKVDSVSFEDADTGDPLPSVSINGKTKVVIDVSKIGGSIVNFNAGAYFTYLPETENEYKNTLTDQKSNFIYKNAVIQGAGTSGNITTSLNAGVLTIEFTIEFTTEEKLKLTEDVSEFLVWVQIEDSAISAGNSDRVPLIAAFTTVTDIDFIVDFVSFSSHEFFRHDQ
jgi:hypothetical protein